MKGTCAWMELYTVGYPCDARLKGCATGLIDSSCEWKEVRNKLLLLCAADVLWCPIFGIGTYRGTLHMRSTIAL